MIREPYRSISTTIEQTWHIYAAVQRDKIHRQRHDVLMGDSMYWRYVCMNLKIMP